MVKSQRKFVLAACAWLPSLSGEDTPSRAQWIWLCAPNPLFLFLPALLSVEIMPDERDEHGQGCGGIELLQVDEKKRKKDLRGENDQGFVAGFGCQESSGPSSVAGFGNWCLWIRHSSRIPAPQCRVSLSQVLPEMMV